MSNRALFAALTLALTGCRHDCPPPAKPTTTTLPDDTTTPDDGLSLPPEQIYSDVNGPLPDQIVADAKAQLRAKYPDAGDRIDRGIDQVASLWRISDGDLASFALEQFAATDKEVDALFNRLQDMLEQVEGHGLELGRSFRWATEVEGGEILPVDPLFAGWDPTAHVTDDMFENKLAFAALLNFPLTTLEQRLRDGEKYTRRQWAEARLTGKFDTRIPAEIVQEATAVGASADQYIAGYNLWMHHVLAEDGKRLFESGKRLISHWNLRDELKADYADKTDGLAKQRTIVMAMQRIVTQTIPAAVIDNPNLDWNPFTNEVTASPAAEIEKDAPAGKPTSPDAKAEDGARHQHVLDAFHAAVKMDAYSPTAPTAMARAFDEAEVPEERMRELLVALLGSPLVGEAAKQIEQALGRPLEPLDLWYEFGGGTIPEAELDKVTKKKYPTAAAFKKDMPRILKDLGFTKDKAKFLSDRIDVDPSRGAGHAMEAERRGDHPHLRTRVEDDGMNYKGYNIAVHELGHNVEQTFSLYSVDYNLLSGVPNTACTEALAFLFQARDLELLGRKASKDAKAAHRNEVLDTFWNTFEIAGSSLVELDVWHWLYDHPDATAQELRDATVKIARDTWDKYYKPVLGGTDVSLLGIYSHTIASPLYLFNYVLGHFIAFQVEQSLAGAKPAKFATQFESISSYGMVTPDLWMVHATGAPIGVQGLLDATEAALKP